MLGEVMAEASIVALVSMFAGIVPLGAGIAYVIWPNEQRLALMRPLSLAAIFAAVTGTMSGLISVFRMIGMSETPAFTRVAAIGIAEALVPIFLAFGCLSVAWLCVTLGLWRRP